MDWPRIVFDQIVRVNTAKPEEYESEVEKLKDVLYPYWVGDEDWQHKVDGIEFTFQKKIEGIHRPPSADDETKIVKARIDRSRSLFRALMNLIHNSTGLLPHKEVEGVIDEYRPPETFLQESKRSDSEDMA